MTIAIERLHAKFRAAPSQHERLRRVLAEVMGGGLEMAADRCGLSDTGETCIRTIHTQIHFKASESDEGLEARLALNLAEAIAAEAGKQDPGIVRYGSMAQAWADFACATLKGDFSRAWAWRQMGITGREFATSIADAAHQVLTALAGKPELAAAVLAQLASDAALFERLLSYGPQNQWRVLAERVAGVFGGDAETLLAQAGPSLVQAADKAAAVRLAERSRIAPATLACRREGRTAPTDPMALAILVLGEIEPAWLGGPAVSARTWVLALAARLAEQVGSQTEAAQTDGQAQDQTASVAKLPNQDAGHPAARPAPSGPATHSGQDPATANLATAKTEQQPGPASESAPAMQAAPQERPPALTPASHELADVRQRGFTTCGGLLYLIHLQGPLVEQIMVDPRLTRRSPRWSLHRLALALLPLVTDDAAALAFAGLLPEADPPCQDQPPADDEERAAVLELREILLAALQTRLARYAIAEADLVDFVCLRPAQIVADPGWLEAHFALDQVSTEIRAVGLDLNPDWVPWLGLVVRFVYG